jgi:hypothetical protein
MATVRAMSHRQTIEDGLAAGALAAVLSGAPSTLHALATRADPLEATLAAGTLLSPGERRKPVLLLAALPVHVALSLGWSIVLAALLPRRRPVVCGTLAGLAIAVLDLGVVGSRYPRIRALPVVPQLLDHAAYGAVVGVVLRVRRAR